MTVAERRLRGLPDQYLSVRPTRVQVRCLGPGPEHSFWSRDKCDNRICPKCARVINSEGYAAFSPLFQRRPTRGSRRMDKLLGDR